MHSIVKSITVILCLVLGGAASAQSIDTKELDRAIRIIAFASISMREAGEELETVMRLADTKTAAVAAAKAIIVESSDWLIKYSDSDIFTHEAHEKRRAMILEQTPILIASERTLAELTDELSAAEVTLQEKKEKYEEARAKIVNIYKNAVQREASNAEVLLAEEKDVSRFLALDLGNVCNDKRVEADEKVCDRYEGKISSEQVLKAAHDAVTNN